MILNDPKRYGKLEVKLYSQFHIYYDGSAESVSANNKTGRFDILPGHANFFTLLSEGVVKVISSGQSFDFKMTRGVAQVSGNKVKVFIDI